MSFRNRIFNLFYSGTKFKAYYGDDQDMLCKFGLFIEYSASSSGFEYIFFDNEDFRNIS